MSLFNVPTVFLGRCPCIGTQPKQHERLFSLLMFCVWSAPCVPQNIQGTVPCNSDILTASWSAAPGASSYLVHIFGRDGYNSWITTPALSQNVSAQKCGTQYYISVMSRNEQCNSSASVPFSITTGRGAEKKAHDLPIRDLLCPMCI